jgi:hypothetical protein
VKAEGSTGDSAQSTVDSFDGSVRESEVDVGANAVAVVADRPCNADEGAEPRATRPTEPLLESLLRAPGLLVTEQMSESPVERTIRPLDLADLGPILHGEIPLGAQKREAGALDRLLALGIFLDADQAAANLVDRIGSKTLNMERSWPAERIPSPP